MLVPDALTQSFSDIATPLTMFGTPLFTLVGSLIVSLAAKRHGQRGVACEPEAPLAPWLKEMRETKR